MRRFLVPFATLSFVTAGCTGAEGTPELERFESCDELHSWVKTSARKDAQFLGARFGGFGGRSLGGDDVALESGGVPAPNVAGSGSAGSYTTTNVQVDGVDEADFVKNDGEHVFMLDTEGLSILDAWPADELHQLSNLDIEGQPASLFFDGADTVVVFSSIWDGSELTPLSGVSMPVEPEQRSSWDPVTKLTVLDVADRAAPQILREIYLDGTLRTSRRIGDKVHVVLTDNLEDVYEPQQWGPLPDAYRNARMQKIRATAPTDWLPRKQDNRITADGWATDEGPACGCTDVYKPTTRTELVFATVATLDLADLDGDLATAGVLTRADTVFASTDALYLAMSEWNAGPFRSVDGALDSRIHKFELTDDGPVYTASGRVPGTLLNQFSMDEHDGFLRLATTDNDSAETSAGVFVVEQDGTSLDTVGRITGLAPGESIFAARFQGDRGYLVTFEQIDPLFTLDLSDPTDPRQVGELEVTGFSNYLHPLPDDRLLAVGEEITTQGEWLGLQVSLFDTSDFADPTLEDRELIEGQGWSEAQYDHHAFTWYAEHDVLSLPIQRWGWNNDYPDNALAVFEVLPGEADAIVPLGEVDHSAWLRGALGTTQAEEWSWCSQVRRSIWLEDRLLTVSEMGIQVTTLDGINTTTAGWTAPDGGCQGWWGMW